MSLFSYLITIFSVVFWFFRSIVCLMASMQMDFVCQPMNLNIEIGLLFATLPCMILIFKRNIIGGKQNYESNSRWNYRKRRKVFVSTRSEEKML